MEKVMIVIAIVCLIASIVTGIYKYIINTDTYDGTDFLNKYRKEE